MLTYLLKRVIAMIPTMLGITLITFLIINFAPGDPVASQQDVGPGATAGGGGLQTRDDTIKAKKKLLGMMKEDHTILAWGGTGPAGPEGEDPPLLPTGRLGELEGWARGVARSPDGATLYVGTSDGQVLALDAVAGELLRNYKGADEAIWSLALSPDGTELVAGDKGGGLFAWEAATGAPIASAPAIGRPSRRIAFLPDGSALYAANDDGSVRRYGARGLAVEARFVADGNSVYALALSPDGAHLWTGGTDRTLKEWSIPKHELVRQGALHPQAVTEIVVSPDGTQLATGCDDRKGRIWQRADWDQPAIELVGHLASLGAVAFSTDGDRVYTGSKDEAIRVWDSHSGALLARTADKVGEVHQLIPLAGGGLLSVSDSWATVPLWRRYFTWLRRVATLDFGRSFVDDRPVMEKLGEALPITIVLNLIAVTIIYLVSIPLGVMAAVKRGSPFDHISSVILFILYSIPSFWLATLLIMSLSSERAWDLLPSVGLHADNAGDMSFFPWLWDSIRHLALPITVMVYGGFASLSRYARTSMLETIQEDYVRTARAKGLSETVVIFKHAFRNSLITIVTLIANLLPAMIGGSVIIEFIFTIEGMGKLGFDAILHRDYPTIMAITTFSAFLTLMGILVSDLLYSVVDPRVGVE